MKEYMFRTTATMKEYNRKNWWIDSGIIREVRACADNLSAALQQYREIVLKEYGIEISDNAIRRKSAMYRDTAEGAEQCGYVITGKTEFHDDRRYKWVPQYIDLWVDVNVVTSAFEEV